MPKHIQNRREHWIFKPVAPPDDMANSANWSTVCIQIPIPLIPYLLNVIRPYLYYTFVDADKDTALVFNSIWRDLVAKITNAGECEMPYQLRQNPQNPCFLEQSIDSGATWTLAYDFSRCIPPANAIQNNILYGDVYNQYSQIVNTYNSGGQSAVAPDATYDGTGEDDIRDIVCCYAARLLIDLACETELEKRRMESAGAAIGSIAIGIVGALVSLGIITVSAGAGTPLVIAIAGALTGGYGIVLGAVSEQVLGDETARELVACCFFSAMYGKTPTKNLFMNSLDGCGFESGTFEAQLAGGIAPVLERDDVFASYLELLQNNFAYGQAGLLPDCPCETPATPSWCVYVDFTTGLNGFNIANIYAQPYGTYQAGVGIVGANVNESGTYSKRVYVQKTGLDLCQITGIDVLMDYTLGTFNATGQWAVVANTNSDSSPNYGSPIRMASAMVTGNNQKIEADYPDLDRTAVLVDIRASRMSTTPPDGSVTLKGLTIRGIGTVPSQLATLPDCNELCWIWNFITSENQPDWVIGWGTYNAGVNTATGYPPSSGVYFIHSHIDCEFGSLLTVNSIEITYDLTKGTYSNGNVAAMAVFGNNDGGSVYSSAVPNSALSNGTDLVRTFAVATANVKSIRIDLNSAGTTGSYPDNPGAGKIKKVKIRYAGNEVWQNGLPC